MIPNTSMMEIVKAFVIKSGLSGPRAKQKCMWI